MVSHIYNIPMLFLLLSLLCIYRVHGYEGLPVCIAQDYRIESSTECDVTTSLRTIIYTLRDISRGACLGPRNIRIESRTCQCSIFEYEPLPDFNSLQSVKSFRSIPESHCRENPTAIKVLSDMIDRDSWLPPECTEKDIGSHFTSCNQAKNRKFLVFYWTTPCRKTGSLRLPSTRELPCDISCPAGQFLAPPKTECQECPSGTYSIDGLVYSYPWRDLPEGFHADCLYSKCNTWTSHGETLSASGSSPRLRMWYNVIRSPSVLSMTYMSSTDLRGMTILVNGEDTTPTKLPSKDPDWSIISIDLSTHDDSNCHHFLSVQVEYNELQEVCLVRNDFVPDSSSMHLRQTPAKQNVEVVAAHNLGCEANDFPTSTKGKVVIVLRGKCRFEEKTRLAQAAGAIAVVHVDNDPKHLVQLRITGNSEGITIPALVTQVKDPHLFFVELSKSEVHVGQLMRHKDRRGKVEVELILSTEPTEYFHIRDISVTGTSYAPEQCQMCPPGYSSPKGSKECIACPANTFSEAWGTGWPCRKCPDNMASTPGSVSCMKRTQCDISDVAVIFGECRQSELSQKYTRELTYQKISPMTCEPSTWVAPTIKEVPCSPCPPGLFLEGAICKSCGTGEYVKISGNKSTCARCTRDTYAQKVIHYDGFADLGGQFPAGWSMLCEFCSPPGWQFVPDNNHGDPRIFLVTGPQFGVLGYGILNILFNLEVAGMVSFTYHMKFDETVTNVRDTMDVSFRVFRKQTVMEKRLHRVDNEVLTKVEVPLPLGEYTMEFKFMWVGSTISDSMFVLRSLDIEGIVDGRVSGQECVPCPSGASCRDGIPQECDKGTYSGVGATCQLCTGNNVASESGAHFCLPCPIGTHTDSRHTTCFLNNEAKIALLDTGVEARYALQEATSLINPVLIQDILVQEGVSINKHKKKSLLVHLKSDNDREKDGGTLPCDDLAGPVVCVLQLEDPSVPPVLLGSSIKSITTTRDPSNIDDVVVQIQLGEGDICDRDNHVKYTTMVLLGCSPIAREEDTTVLRTIRWDECHIILRMEKPSFCPLCTSFRPQEESGNCINGKRLVYRTTKQTCYDFSLKKVIVFGGDAALELPCDIFDDLETNRGIVALVVSLSVLAFIVLSGVAMYLYITKQRMYGKYMKLATSGSDACSTPTTLELEDVDEAKK